MKPTASFRAFGIKGSLPLIVALAALGGAGEAAATEAKFCSGTAKLLRAACLNDVDDNFRITQANCLNIEDDAERSECNEEAKEERREERQLCTAQLRARRDVCRDVGEARYDPSFEPEDFVDPLDIGGSVAANPYFPLEQGRVWVYEGGDEVVTVTVTTEIRTIEGVPCVTVTDVVEGDGLSVEITEDWFAQDLDGNVYYCGELVQNFEEQEDGVAELVDLDGSFKVGREFAKPGILMPAMPSVGQVNRQEFAPGEAEDIAEIVAVDGSISTPAASCDGDCVVTNESNPLEPGAFETKYYAPGIGFLVEIDPETGDRLELTSITIP